VQHLVLKASLLFSLPFAASEYIRDRLILQCPYLYEVVAAPEQSGHAQVPKHASGTAWPVWATFPHPYSRPPCVYASQPSITSLIHTHAVIRWQGGHSFNEERLRETMRTWPTCRWKSGKLHLKKRNNQTQYWLACSASKSALHTYF